MRATDFSRDDCLVGKKRRSYHTLMREYRCADCGGGLSTWYTGDDEGDSGDDYDPNAWAICCARCQGIDFIHERKWARQKADASEVLDGLPPELRELIQ